MPFSAHHFPPEGEATPGARGRVLVVEDDPEAALFATVVLGERGGFEVTHTADPALALVLAASGPWDLVLTDMDLPVMSGLQLLAALRERVPRVPVLLLTASPAGACPAPAARPVSPAGCEPPGCEPPGCEPAGCGPDGLLVKPVPAERLLSAAVKLAADGRRPG
jgi:CheY-like chemotaxis protein